MIDSEIFVNKVVKDVLVRYHDLWALGYVSSVAYWDTETYMPGGAIKERSIVFGKLAVLRQKMLLHPEFVELVEKGEKEEGLNDYEKGVIRVLKRSIEKLKKLPPEFVEEFSKVTNQSRVVWRQAKEKNDYELFAPYLEKIIELSRKRAEYLGYEEHPYDALLDYYEEGLLTRELDALFSKLKPHIIDLYRKILNSSEYLEKHPLEDEKYDKDKMHELNLKIMKLLGFPFEYGRLDISAHPFTIGIGIRDVRITSRYAGFDFKRSLLATIHEFGHALYELQQDEKLMGTPVTGGVSMGVHESQSRFWENMIGRNLKFVEAIHNDLKQYLPFIEKYDSYEVYRYLNLVRPELIRVEADEVTYNLHIILRFEMEKMFMEEKVDVKELPQLWENKIEEYLGVRPKNYAEGILQDIHWSQGSIGYFPTYSLGTILAVQVAKKLEKEVAPLDDVISKKDFSPIRNWLKEKIHKWGAIYPPKELIKRALGEEIRVEPFIEHLREKYGKLYGF